MNILTKSKSGTLERSFQIYWYELRNEFLKNYRTPGFALPSLLFPVMFYVFFGLVFNKGSGSNAPAYLMATYSVFGMIGPALFSFGVGVSIEKEQGWLALKQSSPMPIFSYFVAKILSAQLFGLVIALSLFLLAGFFGGVALSLADWSLTLFSLVLGCLPFAALGLWLGLTLSGQSAPAIVNLIYLPMAFLAGLWIPISFLPDFLQWFAWILPAFHLSQLTLSIQGYDLGFAMIWHVMSLLIMTFLFLILAVRAFPTSK